MKVITDFRLSCISIGILSCVFLSIGERQECVPKEAKYGIVCVCNSTYCDQVGPIEKPPSGRYLVFTSSKSGHRLQSEEFNFSTQDFSSLFPPTKLIKLQRQKKRQTICGFGGAFTDATGINVKNLSQGAQNNLLKSYFSPEGIEYTLGRVPIGGTDFSTRPYTYDDLTNSVSKVDFNLTSFSLQDEDLKYKIPLIQQAQVLASKPLKLFASAWSPPAWMKSNGKLNGMGYLKGKPGGLYYQTWANYHVRFLEEYGKHNITFWGLTSGNEPANGNIPYFPFNCLGYLPSTLGTFLGQNLGPTLNRSGYGAIQLMAPDDQRPTLLLLPEILSEKHGANRYVNGLAFHWYLNFLVPPEILDIVHNRFQDKFILSTEACEGSGVLQKSVTLGNWDRAQSYALDLIQDLSNWVCGWTDWNMALDDIGGPNWVSNTVDSPIIINATSDEFYKQPMFYALGHFSKFILPNSTVITVSRSLTASGLELVAVVRPDNGTVVVVLNRKSKSQKFVIKESGNQFINAEIPAHSIQTYIWWSY